MSDGARGTREEEVLQGLQSPAKRLQRTPPKRIKLKERERRVRGPGRGP